MSTRTEKPAKDATRSNRASAHSDRLRTGDMIIRRFVINQPKSRLGLHQGWFRDTLSGHEHEQLRAHFLLWHRGRVFFDDPQDAMPTCKSANGLAPSPQIAKPKGDTCGHWNENGWFVPECPLAAWRFYDGRQCAPVCQETWSFLGVLEEDGEPFWLSIKGSSLRPARHFLSMCQAVIRSGRQELLDCGITLSTKLLQGRTFQYYAAQFSEPLWLVKADPKRKGLKKVLRSYGRADIQDTFDAEQAEAPAPAMAG